MSETLNAVSGRYRPYRAYKVSGVERLGDVPKHWKIKKATWLFNIGSGTTPNSSNESYYGGDTPWVTTGELRENTITQTEKRLTQLALRNHSSLRIYPRGSLVIAMYGATIGRLGILGIDSTVNQACCVFSQSKDIDIMFTFYWLQMRRPFLISLGYGGGQPNLSQELLRSLRIPTPSLSEQKAIVRFLEHKTSQIDALIAAKERLISLLQEKRAALITTAVTKGLDPSVPMKDSGIEWLGEIPAHWDVTRSKWLFTVRNERARPDDKQLSATQAYGVISQEEFMKREGRRVTQITQHLDKRKHVEIDDFVISMRSFQGGLERAWETGCIRSSYVVLQPSSEINEDFFAYLFKSNRYIHALRATSNFIRDGQDLNFKNFSLVDLPKIPFSEQKAIGQFLDQKMSEIDELMMKVKEGIKCLQEYRTALISAAVTGKIDVRDAQEPDFYLSDPRK